MWKGIVQLDKSQLGFVNYRGKGSAGRGDGRHDLVALHADLA